MSYCAIDMSYKVEVKTKKNERLLEFQSTQLTRIQSVR